MRGMPGKKLMARPSSTRKMEIGIFQRRAARAAKPVMAMRAKLRRSSGRSMNLSLLLQGSKGNLVASQHPETQAVRSRVTAFADLSGAKFGEDLPRIRTISGPFPPHYRTTLFGSGGRN